ncbi:MAG: ABC transporter substrate-binding protein [Eubacteriales bacterium]|nr:ABC transporter substrate-binding protein [Eubacteriales bacterium]
MTNRNKRALRLSLSLCLAFLMSACALPSPVPVEDGAPNVASNFTPGTVTNAQPDAAGEYLVDTTDMAGNAVRLSAYPERIVVLDPADCEILYAIGAGPNVVGRSLTCDYPAEVNLLPYATANGKNDPDVLLLREPQVVVMGLEDAADADLVSALTGAGVAIVVTNVTDINNMYGAISLLGAITNHTSEANTLVSQLITAIAALQTKATSHSETVYLELSPLASGMTTLGSGNIFTAMVSLLGYHNEFEDQSGLLSVTQDQVVGRSPGYIITVSRDRSADAVDPSVTADPTATADPNAAPPELTGPAEILARSEWAQVDAIKKQRVFYIDPALITRAGPRIVDGLNALYTALYENKQPEF